MTKDTSKGPEEKAPKEKRGKVYKLAPRVLTQAAPAEFPREKLQGPQDAPEAPSAAPTEAPTPVAPAAPPGPPIGLLDSMREIFSVIEDDNADEARLKEAAEKFTVKDFASADWVAGKMAMWQNEIERRKEAVQRYVLEAQRNLDRLNWMFLGQLRAWAEKNCPQDKKHIKLPSAILQFTDTQPKLEIENEAALLTWAAVHCEEAVDTKTVFSLQTLKDYWLETKEVPKGCVEIPKGTNFKVR